MIGPREILVTHWVPNFYFKISVKAPHWVSVGIATRLLPCAIHTTRVTTQRGDAWHVVVARFLTGPANK